MNHKLLLILTTLSLSLPLTGCGSDDMQQHHAYSGVINRDGSVTVLDADYTAAEHARDAASKMGTPGQVRQASGIYQDPGCANDDVWLYDRLNGWSDATASRLCYATIFISGGRIQLPYVVNGSPAFVTRSYWPGNTSGSLKSITQVNALTCNGPSLARWDIYGLRANLTNGTAAWLDMKFAGGSGCF